MRLKALRKRAHMTLEDVAALIGVSYQTISNWEKGITEPDINSIKKLASYFQVTTDYLLEQDGDDAYMLDIFKKLEYLDKDKLLGITKSIITDLLGNLTEEENINKKIKKK
jgi:transcriptional regulator with XRE-family HTH domain